MPPPANLFAERRAMKNLKRLTRRAALSGIAAAVGAGAIERRAAAAAQAAPARDPLAAIPISGRAGPGLEPLDAAMRTIIDRHGLAGAALAIAREGRLVLAKGYG